MGELEKTQKTSKKKLANKETNMGGDNSKYDNVALKVPADKVNHFPGSHQYISNQDTELLFKSKFLSSKVRVKTVEDDKEVFIVRNSCSLFSPTGVSLGLSCVGKGFITKKWLMRYESNGKSLVYATLDGNTRKINVFLHPPYKESDEEGFKIKGKAPDIVVKRCGNTDHDILYGDPKNNPFKIATKRTNKILIAAQVDIRFAVLLATYSEHLFQEMDGA